MPSSSSERRSSPRAGHDHAPIVDSRTAGGLAKITRASTMLAIWRRSPPDEMAAWLDALPPGRLPEGRFVTTADLTPRHLARLCEAAALPASPQRTWLIDDISLLVSCFTRITRRRRTAVQLQAIDHDSCWRFHRDHVGYRLNSTYRGPGTQWPPLDSAEKALRSQRRYRGPLNELPRFAVGLFKGVKHCGPAAVVHRSPPVARRGLTRLFLCLNEENDDE